MPCRLVLVQSASATQSKPSPASIQTVQSNQLTGSEHSIWCRERPCSLGYATWRGVPHSSLSWPSFTVNLPSICEDNGSLPHHSPRGRGRAGRSPHAGTVFFGPTWCVTSSAGHIEPTECLLPFLDDTYLVTEPARIATVHRELGFHLWTHARISLHAGKTQIWNRSGQCPPGCEGIFEAARVSDPDAMVWKGDQSLPTANQGDGCVGRPSWTRRFCGQKVGGQNGRAQSSVSKDSRSTGSPVRMVSVVIFVPLEPITSYASCNQLCHRGSQQPMIRTCGVVFRSCLASRGREFGSCRLCRSHLKGWVCEARFVAGLPRTGPVGQTHSQESEKDILGLLTLLEPPCFETDFQRAVVCRLQRSAETGFWTWVSVPQSGET